jgi:membrane glycosyltransferase
MLLGVAGLAGVYLLAPGLVLWLLPVALPMCLAPVIIAWTSQHSRSALMTVPSELVPAPVILRHRDILLDWAGVAATPDLSAPAPAGASAPLHA